MLTIIRGLPGSGKSTYAKTHFPGVLNVEQDMYFIKNDNYKYDKDYISEAVEMCRQITKTALKYGADVVISNTFIYKAHVDSYIFLAKEYNQPYQIIRLDTNYGNIHNVPSNVYERMKANFENYSGEIIIKE